VVVVINGFSRLVTGFHRQAKLFELNFFVRNTFCQMVKPGVIFIEAGQLAHGLNEIPGQMSCLSFSSNCFLFDSNFQEAVSFYIVQ